jgi:hypothetical protein
MVNISSNAASRFSRFLMMTSSIAPRIDYANSKQLVTVSSRVSLSLGNPLLNVASFEGVKNLDHGRASSASRPRPLVRHSP